MSGTSHMLSVQKDSLLQYFREIGGYAPLTSEEERELAERIGQGDTTARDALVKANLRFVVTVARKYEGKGMGLSDLICEGNVGLLRATETFDGAKGFRFISYAVWWIRQAIREALSHTRTVRLPMNRIASLGQIGSASRELEQEYGRSATAEEISDEIGMGASHIRETLLMGQNVVSLDAVYGEDNERCLGDVVADEHSSPEAEMMDRSLGEDMEAVLASLDARQADVLRLYFGLGGRERLTLEEIGGLYGITRERIRQIKDQALARLRRRARRRRLGAYLEG